MNKGRIVMVRSTMNQAIIRQIRAEKDETVVICREDICGVGVEIPKKDIFVYDTKLFEDMKQYDGVLDTNPTIIEKYWAKAEPVYR